MKLTTKQRLWTAWAIDWFEEVTPPLDAVAVAVTAVVGTYCDGEIPRLRSRGAMTLEEALPRLPSLRGVSYAEIDRATEEAAKGLPLKTEADLKRLVEVLRARDVVREQRHRVIRAMEIFGIRADA